MNAASHSVRATSKSGAARAFWAVTDQGVSSATNFVLFLLVVRSLDIHAVGAFSIAYAVYFITLVATKGLSIEPLLVRCTTLPRRHRHDATRSAVGQVLVLGLVMGGLTAMAGLFAGGPLAEALLPLGFSMPGLVVQDAWRFVLLAERRAKAACSNDLIRLGVQLALYLAVSQVLAFDLFLLVGVWGLSAAVCAVVGSIQMGLRPRPAAAWIWLREHHDISVGFAADYLAQRASQQIALALIGAVAGLAGLGAVGAARMLFAPLTTVQSGINVLAIPEGARLRQRHTNLARYAALLSSAMAFLVLAVGGILHLVPPWLGQAILGANWSEARAVLVPVMVLHAAIAACGGFWVLLRILGAGMETFYLRFGFGLATVAAAAAGAALFDAGGGIWGMGLTSFGLCLAMRRVAFQRLRRSKSSKREVQAWPAIQPARK